MSSLVPDFVSHSALLPHDVLRLIVEYAAHEDTKLALVLARVSRLVQRWTDLILYSNITLRHPSAQQAFLRTLDFAPSSPSKPPSFFATHVLALAIAHGPSACAACGAARIIAACSGVQSLTVWGGPGGGGWNEGWAWGCQCGCNACLGRSRRTPSPDFLDHTFESELPQSYPYPFWNGPAPQFLRRVPPGPRLYLSSSPLNSSHFRFVPSQSTRKNDPSPPPFPLQPFTPSIKCPQPKRLSAHLPAVLHALTCSTGRTVMNYSTTPSTISSPAFGSLFFAKLTHLAVVNKWEDWVGWEGWNAMRFLSHLSLDLAVGGFTGSSTPALQINATTLSVNNSRLHRIASRIGDVLEQCQALKVLVVLLLFDHDPLRTAREVGRLVSLKIGERKSMVVRREWRDEFEFGYDPRLVFLHDSKPFRERDAHSRKEREVWRRAEALVSVQQKMMGPVVLEV